MCVRRNSDSMLPEQVRSNTAYEKFINSVHSNEGSENEIGVISFVFLYRYVSLNDGDTF